MPGDFVKLPRWLLGFKLSLSAKVVYSVIADRVGQNETAWPGLRSLQKDCGIGRHAVIRAVRDLEESGLLSVDRPANLARGRPNRYSLTVPKAHRKEAEYGAESAPLDTVQKAHRCAFSTPVRCAFDTPNGAQSAPELDPLNQTNTNQTQGGAGGNGSVAPGPPKPDRPKKPTAAEQVDGLPMPTPLDTPAFRAAWSDWRTYRASDLRKPVTPISGKQQLKTLEGYGHDDAIESIRQSIRSQWTGLFPPNGGGRAGGGNVENLARLKAKPGKYANIGIRAVARRAPPADGPAERPGGNGCASG